VSSTALFELLLLGGAFLTGAVLTAVYFLNVLRSEEAPPEREPAEERPSPGDADGESGSLRETTEPLPDESSPGPSSEPPDPTPEPSPAGPAGGRREVRETASLGDPAPEAKSERTERISRDEIESLATGDAEDQRAYLIVVSGSRVGEMVAVDGELVLGRDPRAADVSFRDETVSARHARLKRYEDRTIIEDLDSANGTFVDARRVERSELEDGDKITLGRTTVLKFTFQDELDEEFQQQMYESSTRDQLTKALSKAHFLDRIKGELSYARRHGTNICVIIFDIDHFKRVNDIHGHVAGDRILRELGQLVRSITRDEALVCRYGGEEFAIAERNAGVETGARIAERIRAAVADHPFEIDGREIDVTISLGVADLEAAGSDATPTELIERADESMYRAKDEGRNCVRVARKPRGDG